MPEVDEKVMKFVGDVLKKDPQIQLEELFQRTKKVHPSIRNLSKRQFNARYPLQVKRRRALAARGKSPRQGGRPQPRQRTQKKTPIPSGEPRDVVRHVFLQFATDITAAEERKDLVKVLAGVDRYVDQVLKGVAKG